MARLREVRLSTAVGLVVVLVGAVVGISALRDNSFLTHLATGRLILDEGRVPSTDPYSFTAGGEPWVVQSWLVSVAYASLEALGGAALVRVALGVATGALAGIVWLLTAPARNLVVRLALAGLVVVAGAGLWSERPLLVGLLGLGLLLLGAEGRFDPRWSVPILWVWANAHGSFPLGLLALFLLWLGRRLDGEDGTTEWRMGIWAGVGTLVAVVGPLGLEVLTFPFELLSRQDVLADVKEWGAPEFQSPGERLFLVLVVVAVVAAVRRPRWRAALPLVVFLVLALTASRNQVTAALVFLPGTAAGLAGLGSAGFTGAETSRVATLAAAVVGVLGLLVVASPLTAEAEPGDELVGGPHHDLDGYPVAAVAWLDAEGLLGPDQRIVARDLVGNYLESLPSADTPVFVDDRFDMYPADVLDDHTALIQGQSTERGGPLELLEHYDATAVVWQDDGPLAQLLAASPDWAIVYQDDDHLVACPRGEAGVADCGSGAAP